MKKVIIILSIIIALSIAWYLYDTGKFLPKLEEEEEISEEEELFTFTNMDESLSPEIAAGFERQFYEAVELIKQEKGALGWAVAGTNKKAVHDFYGAEAIFLKGLEKYPTSDVLNNNLADLYYHFIEDFNKAEEHFLKVIELKPALLGSYKELAIMYRVRFKDQKKAINILLTGLENNPQNKELMATLANLYNKYEMTEEAKAVWQELIELYPDDKDLFMSELESLK